MFRRFLRDERAGLAVMSAMLSPIVLMVGAMAVDLGAYSMQKRALQAATDLAALAAAANPTRATAAAQTNLTLNGFPTTALVGAVTGNYTADATLAPAQRFASAATGNAVQVTTTTSVPSYFGSILNMMTSGGSPGGNAKVLTAQATAVSQPQTAFGIGSGVASLSSGILNSELSGLTGGNVSLSVADYNSLASANVSLFSMDDNLATYLGVTAGTYNQPLNTSVSQQALLTALSQTLSQTSGVALSTLNDVTSLVNSLSASSADVSLSQLASFGADGTLGLNSAAPLTASTSALNLLSAIAGLSNGTNQATVNLSGTVAPIASATLAIDVGQRPVNTPYVTVGSTGATVSTAQVRLLLTLQIAQVGTTSLLNLPIYMELGYGTATLASTTCPTPTTSASASLSVTPGLVNAWIGSVTPAAMANFSAEPTVSPVTILNIVGLGSITAKANASISDTTPTTVNFSASQIANATPQVTSTTDYTSSLLSSLFGNLTLSANLAGLTVTVPPTVTSALNATLSSATPAIDSLLSGLLANVGVSVGTATTWVSGVSCTATKLAM